MQTLARFLLASLLALAIAMPGIGGEGGENAGGTGVWILPHSRSLSGPMAPLTAGTLSRQVSDFSRDFTMTASEDCGELVAVATVVGTGQNLPLAVTGHDVRLSSQQLTSLRNANVTGLTIVISDSQNVGYVISVSGIATGTATFSIR